MLSRRIKRKDGTFVKFTKNRILLLSTSQKFLGTRIYGVYFKELKLMANKNKSSNVKHFKLLSYSNSII
jgi:ribosomal protein L14